MTSLVCGNNHKKVVTRRKHTDIRLEISGNHKNNKKQWEKAVKFNRAWEREREIETQERMKESERVRMRDRDNRL